MFKVGDWAKVTKCLIQGDAPVGTISRVKLVKPGFISGEDYVYLECQELWYNPEQLELLPEKLVNSKLWKALK